MENVFLERKGIGKLKLLMMMMRRRRMVMMMMMKLVTVALRTLFTLQSMIKITPHELLLTDIG